MFELASGTKDHLLLNAVIDVKKDMIDLLEENYQLRIENHELKNQAIISSELKMIRNAYYRGKDLEGPFCSVCWDKDSKLIRMHVFQKGSCSTLFKCGVCGTSYTPGIIVKSGDTPHSAVRKMLQQYQDEDSKSINSGTDKK